jgi:hypothetical protein
MLGFAVWIVMGYTGGASPVSLNAMLNIPSIDLSSGKMVPLKMFRCATWAMFSSLVMQAQVVTAPMMTTCLEIDA